MPNRTVAQLRNHYEVERTLAEKLRNSDREERKVLYGTLYDELFEKVPDHPRLTKREDPALVLKKNKSKLKMVRKLLHSNTVFAEIAPGDCEFCFYVADSVNRVYGMDISDQTSKNSIRPDNFQLIIYDGYSLPMLRRSVDVLFSDQFIEHLHPEDVQEHYTLARSLLVEGGKYVFRYPHLFRGPSDISQYFSKTPTGFHLNESTFTATVNHLKQAGYSAYQCYWFLRSVRIPVPFWWVRATERLVEKMPLRYRSAFAALLLPTVHMEATK